MQKPVCTSAPVGSHALITKKVHLCVCSRARERCQTSDFILKLSIFLHLSQFRARPLPSPLLRLIFIRCLSILFLFQHSLQESEARYSSLTVVSPRHPSPTAPPVIKIPIVILYRCRFCTLLGVSVHLSGVPKLGNGQAGIEGRCLHIRFLQGCSSREVPVPAGP